MRQTHQPNAVTAKILNYHCLVIKHCSLEFLIKQSLLLITLQCLKRESSSSWRSVSCFIIIILLFYHLFIYAVQVVVSHPEVVFVVVVVVVVLVQLSRKGPQT